MNEANEEELNHFLDLYTVPPADTQLRKQIIQQALKKVPTASSKAGIIQELLAALGGWRLAAPALAFSMLFGISISLFSHTPFPDTQSTTLWELAMLSIDQEISP